MIYEANCKTICTQLHVSLNSFRNFDKFNMSNIKGFRESIDMYIKIRNTKAMKMLDYSGNVEIMCFYGILHIALK